MIDEKKKYLEERNRAENISVNQRGVGGGDGEEVNRGDRVVVVLVCGSEITLGFFREDCVCVCVCVYVFVDVRIMLKNVTQLKPQKTKTKKKYKPFLKFW